MRQRRDKGDTDPFVRVRVFINHLDFARSWQFEQAKLIGKQLGAVEKANAIAESMSIKWESLPEIILEQLEEMAYIGETPKEIRAVDIYASVDKRNDAAKHEFELWLDEDLDPLPGFQVHTFSTKKENKKICKQCDRPLDRSELVKGLNTKVACDLLSHAVNDSYDIAVLIMDDPEIVPSVLGVQEIFDKQIIHVGSRGEGDALRSAAWGNFYLDRLVSQLMTSDDFKRKYKKK